MTPKWLTRSIVGTVATIAFVAVGWSGACTAAGWADNPLAKTEQCKDADNRALQTLFSLLAALVSLRSNPPE
jgi:hypothetical protein